MFPFKRKRKRKSKDNGTFRWMLATLLLVMVLSIAVTLIHIQNDDHVTDVWRPVPSIEATNNAVLTQIAATTTADSRIYRFTPSPIVPVTPKGS